MGVLLAKNQLVSDLWLPAAQQLGGMLYPMLRKNKKMKLLTLTTCENYQEVVVLEQNNLTRKEYIVAWEQSRFGALRLQTEIPLKVLGATRYESAVLTGTHSIGSYFPFDIVNLDFSSQQPVLGTGRIENEIHGLEKTVKLQRDKNVKTFVLIYTTLINSHSLSYETIAGVSNAEVVKGWPGLSLSDYPSTVGDSDMKETCLDYVLMKVYSKYGYVAHSKKKIVPLSTEKGVYSTASLIRPKEDAT